MAPPNPGLSWQLWSDIRCLVTHEGQILEPGVVAGADGGCKKERQARGCPQSIRGGMWPGAWAPARSLPLSFSSMCCGPLYREGN